VIQQDRVGPLNRKRVQGGRCCTGCRPHRGPSTTHALEYAIAQANELAQPLVVYFGLTESYAQANDKKTPGGIPQHQAWTAMTTPEMIPRPTECPIMSPYLYLRQISALYVALQVLETGSPAIEAYLEELSVRQLCLPLNSASSTYLNLLTCTVVVGFPAALAHRVHDLPAAPAGRTTARLAHGDHLLA